MDESLQLGVTPSTVRGVYLSSSISCRHRVFIVGWAWHVEIKTTCQWCNTFISHHSLLSGPSAAHTNMSVFLSAATLSWKQTQHKGGTDVWLQARASTREAATTQDLWCNATQRGVWTQPGLHNPLKLSAVQTRCQSGWSALLMLRLWPLAWKCCIILPAFSFSFYSRGGFV